MEKKENFEVKEPSLMKKWLVYIVSLIISIFIGSIITILISFGLKAYPVISNMGGLVGLFMIVISWFLIVGIWLDDKEKIGKSADWILKFLIGIFLTIIAYAFAHLSK